MALRVADAAVFGLCNLLQGCSLIIITLFYTFYVSHAHAPVLLKVFVLVLCNKSLNHFQLDENPIQRDPHASMRTQFSELSCCAAGPDVTMELLALLL